MNREMRMAQMQNVFGAFVQLANDGNTQDMEWLFTEDARLEVPELKVFARGNAEICRKLSAAFSVKKQEGIRYFHVPHNLCGTLEEDGGKGRVYAESHSFVTDEKDSSAAMFCTRFDMNLKREGEQWKIDSLCWYVLQYFEPYRGETKDLIIYENKNSGIPAKDAEQKTAGTYGAAGMPSEKIAAAGITGEDHVAIQNLMGRFCIWNRREAQDLFADSDAADLHLSGLTEDTEEIGKLKGKARICALLDQLAQKEKANLNCYLSIPYLGAPVILTEGDTAEGWWISHTNMLRSALFERNGQEDSLRRIERFHGTFVRQNGNWKIRTLDTSVLAQLPAQKIDREMHGQVSVWDGQDHWPPVPEYDGNFAAKHPQDIYELQRIFPKWGLGLRRAEMQKTPERIFISDQDRVDIDIHIRRNIGIQNNLFRLEEFDENCRPHQTTSHNTSTPYFYVNEAGDRAEISWFDESWTNMNAVFKREDYPVNFMLNVAEYRFTFEKEPDKGWRVQRIWWRVIYRLPDLQMNMEKPCFCNTDKEHVWPMPFDTVYYWNREMPDMK